MARSNAQGWALVALCFLALSLSMSGRSALGLTMPIWETELGWSRSFVSSTAALTLIVTALVAPFAGNAVDRVGPRALLTGGLVATGLGILLTAQASAHWHFLLSFGVIGALGFGVVAVHLVSTTIAGHFTESRGLATGIATAGSTAGQLLVIPLLALTLATLGWRIGFLAHGIAALLLAVAMWLIVRPLPAKTAAQRRQDDAGIGGESLGRRLRFLATSPVFHALFWSFAICGFTTSGVIETHLIPYTVTCGFPPLTGATAYGVLAAFNMLGMVLSGWLTDRMHRPLLLGTIYIGRGLSFILLMQIAGDAPLLFLFAVAFGFFDFSTVPPTASLVASHLGLRIMGLAMGLLSAGHALGGALGAFLGGYLYDLFARYDWIWSASIALAIAAGLMCYAIRETRRPAGLQPQAA